MLIYSNSFSLSVSDNKNECILSFKQNYPNLGDKGEVKNILTETIAEIALNKDGAVALCSLLNNALGDNQIVD